ncbi:MAG: DUF2207 domain-containing protein [Clostridia bacterium]|nr:DUF2207 domain-containing protein [Clostridia bacterium]MDD4387217.1 DUF2207 domain-containing protein [Clostridia bacterium]
MKKYKKIIWGIFAYVFLIFTICGMLYIFGSKKGIEVAIIIYLILIVLNLSVIIAIKKKYRLSLDKITDYEYWRDAEFVDIDPIYADYLLHKTDININGIIATIFLLEQKSVFNIEMLDDQYYITLNIIDKDIFNNLKTHEQEIVKFLFDNIKDSQKVNLSERIKDINNNYETKVIINHMCEKIECQIDKKMYKEIKLKDFEVRYMVLDYISIFYSYMGLIIAFFVLSGAGTLGTILFVMWLIHSISFIYQSVVKSGKYFKDKYLQEMNMLNGLYNFLLDFSAWDYKDMKYVKIYEKFFVYALCFGITDKVEKQFGQENIKNNIITNIEILIKSAKK